jgi:hypothetical protein
VAVPVADGRAAAEVALATALGDSAPVADPATGETLSSTPATGVAAACPAWDGWPQPATAASRAAETALANAKRRRRRGYRGGISGLSFNHAGRPDDLQWSG